MGGGEWWRHGLRERERRKAEVTGIGAGAGALWWELVEILFSLQLFFSVKWKARSSAMSVMIEGAGQLPHVTSWWLGGKVAFVLGPSTCAAQSYFLWPVTFFPGLYPSLSTATCTSDFYLPEII